MTCHIAGARVDPQQVCSASHDNAKGPVRAGPLSQVVDVFEFGDTESLVQAEVTAAFFSCGIIRYCRLCYSRRIAPEG